MNRRAERSKSGGFSFDFSDLSFVYTILFALSLVLINPRGGNLGQIWTAPKFKVVIALTVLNLVILAGAALTRRRQGSTQESSPLGRLWRVGFGLWLAFLGSGAVTIFLSPVTFRSARIANNEMGDGWLYWFCMATLVLSNALILRRFPKLFRAQLYGFLLGGSLTVLAIFVQTVDWRIDFTDTSGRIYEAIENVRLLQTQSSIPKSWMPIGFTSIRGHVGFIVAALGVLSLVCLVRGWVRKRYAWPLYALFLISVYLTSTRGVQLAFAIGMLYLLVRFWRAPGGKRVMLIAFLPLILGGGLLASGVLNQGQQRKLPSLQAIVKNPIKFTSARSNLWPSAVRGIRERPLFGWGFNGFGLAWPHVNNFKVRWIKHLARVPDPERPGKTKPVYVERILRNNHSSFEYLGEDGNVYRVSNLTNKAHNIILDTTVSLGIVGAFVYATLFIFFLIVTARGAAWGLEVVAVVYFVYGLTWFESAQYSHLTWWALSVGLAFYALPRALAQNEVGRRAEGRTIVIAPGVIAPRVVKSSVTAPGD